MRRLAPLSLALLLLSLPVSAQMRPQPRQPATQATPAPGGEITERLVMTPPSGWIAGGQGGGQRALTTHLFPPGQNAENWSEMLSIQIVADPNAGHREHIQRVVDASRDNCEAYGPSPVAEGQTNGYPVASLTVTCTKGRNSGMGGLVAVKAIRGGAALYVIQRTWRGPPFDRNDPAPVPSGLMQEWSSFLRNVSLCDTNEAMRHPCPK